MGKKNRSGRSAVPKKSLVRRMWKNRWGYLFLLPVFLIMGVFKYYPTFLAVIMSFCDWNGFNPARFTGLKNYIALFHDRVFLASMKNVSIICLTSLAKTFIFPLMAAELVYYVRPIRFRNASKYLFVMPMVVPAMVTVLMWKWIYNPSFGAMNQLLALFGMNTENLAWLGNSKTALFSIIFMGFPWIEGTAFLIVLSGLQSIPVDLYEAAKIDGAGWWRRFTAIDLPLIVPQMRILAINAMITALGSFENVLVMTNGGPGDFTMVPALHMYQQGMTFYRMGYACAIGMVIFAIVLVFTLLSFRLKKQD